MQLQQLVFVIGGLIVGVTSEQICSVCGDGYQVGNPSAISSVPLYPDIPATCDDIELAGLQGMIPISQCSSLPFLIFETCNCQAMHTTAEKTHEYTKGSGYSSQRRVQSLYSPSNSDPEILEVAPAATPMYPGFGGFPDDVTISFDDDTVTVIFPNAHGNSSDDVFVDDDDFFVPLVVIAMSLCFLWAMCHMAIEHRNRHYSVLTTTGASSTVSISKIDCESDEDAKRRRPLVLEILFPKEAKPEGQTEGLSTKSGETDHPESKRHVICDEILEGTSCSICMECLETNDNDNVTGRCSHVYHRACIMNWMQLGHDECPNCRQPMWDSVIYKMVDQGIIKGQQHHPIQPSVPLIV